MECIVCILFYSTKQTWSTRTYTIIGDPLDRGVSKDVDFTKSSDKLVQLSTDDAQRVVSLDWKVYAAHDKTHTKHTNEIDALHRKHM